MQLSLEDFPGLGGGWGKVGNEAKTQFQLGLQAVWRTLAKSGSPLISNLSAFFILDADPPPLLDFLDFL